MRLWTWHKPDFSLFDGHVDHEQSEFVKTVPGVKEAYKELTKLLGTDQFIWCYTTPGQRKVLPHHTEVEWILDVPANEILAFLDDVVWNRVLGIHRFVPPRELEIQWQNKSFKQYPHNLSARKDFVKSCRTTFWNQTPPSGSWWDYLFVANRCHESVIALLCHPVHADWVATHPTA